MYICVYAYRCMHVGIRICVRMHVWVLSMYLCLYVCVWLCATVFRIRLVRSGPLQETRFGFVLVVDPIHRRFEDRSMGWSVDQYQFVQWRLDSDSVSKLRHFMWVFVLVHFLIYRCRYAFTCYTYHYMWLSVIFYLFDYLYHFMRHL